MRTLRQLLTEVEQHIKNWKNKSTSNIIIVRIGNVVCIQVDLIYIVSRNGSLFNQYMQTMSDELNCVVSAAPYVLYIGENEPKFLEYAKSTLKDAMGFSLFTPVFRDIRDNTHRDILDKL